MTSEVLGTNSFDAGAFDGDAPPGGPPAAPKPLRFWQRTSTRLAIVMVLILAPLAVHIGYRVIAARRAAIEQADAELHRLAGLLASSFDLMLGSARDLSVALAELDAVRLGDADACTALLTRVAARFDHYTFFARSSPDQPIACSSQTIGDSALAGWVSSVAVAETGKFAISRVLIGPVSDLPVLVVSLPILRPDGSVHHVLSAGLSLTQIGRNLRNETLGPGVSFTISDRRGRIWRRYLGPATMATEVPRFSDGVAPLLDDPGPHMEDATGRTFLFGRAEVPGVPEGLHILALRPADHALRDIDRQSLVSTGLSTLVVGLALIAAWSFTTFTVLRPIARLRTMATRLGSGDYAARARATSFDGEFGVLAHALDATAESLERTVGALRRSGAMLSSVLDATKDAIVYLDRDGAIRLLNGPAADLLDVRREGLVGRAYFDLLPAEVAAARRQWIEAVWQRGIAVEHLERIGPGWFETVIAPIHAGPEVRAVTIYTRDVTARRHAELQLQASEARYRLLVATIAEGILEIDHTGRIVSANPSACDILGMAASEIDGRPLRTVPWQRLQDPATPMAYNEIPPMRALALGRPVDRVLTLIRRPDDSYRWLSVNARPVLGSDDRAGHAVVVSFADVTELKEAQDRLQALHTELEQRVEARTRELQIANQRLEDEIEERRAAQAALEESERRYRDIAECASDWFFTEDRRLGSLTLSESFEKVTGLARSEVDATALADLIAGGDPAGAPGAVLDTIAAEAAFRDLEAVWRLPTGRHLWVRMSAVPMHDREGRFVGYRGAATDISERRRTEELLRMGGRLARLGGWHADPVGRAVWVTDEVRRILDVPDGVEPDDARGLSLCPPAARPGLARAFDRALADAAPFDLEMPLATWSGRRVWVRVIGQPERRADRSVALVGVIQDITDRRRAEDEIRQLTERVTLATRAARVGIWDYDLVHDRLVWDDTMYALYATDRAGFAGTFAAWRDHVHPDDRERAEGGTPFALGGPLGDHDTTFRILHPNGEVRTIQAFAMVHHDETGTPVRLVGTNWDITEIARAQTALVEAKERAEAANAAKTRFLATMSHELRTPLNAIIGFAELLTATEPVAKRREQLGIMHQAAHNLLTLINDILDLARIEEGRVAVQTAPFAMRGLLAETMELMRPQATTRGLALTLEVAPDLPDDVNGDVRLLRQVLVNLIGNAIKFTEHGGITVRAAVAARDETTAAADPPATSEPAPAVWLRCEVVDTGIGIRPENLARVFEMFEQEEGTYVRRHGGTGLGLAISRRLVALMGGEITAHSTPGEGSRFTFTCRLARADNAA